ncbi:HvfC/BufC N-terminal domain-containing protein [Burkholderia sp. PU8-34]
MPSLHDVQEAFAAAIVEQDAARVEALVAGADAGARLAVYVNNVHQNLLEALRAVYPVVERLVGARFFAHAASRYIHDHPSASGDIQRFGSTLPAFLAHFAPAASLPYLADTAALEWLLHEVFHAADHAPLALSRLTSLLGMDCSALRFRLHPACRLFASDSPVLKIWQINQPGADPNETVDAGAGGDLLLIRRVGFAVDLEPLGQGEFAMLHALREGKPVDDAYELALLADRDFKLGEFIQRRISDATLVDFIACPRTNDAGGLRSGMRGGASR